MTNTILFKDSQWLLSEEAFLLYSSCMYQPTYEEYKLRMEGYLNDPSVKVFVCEKAGMMILKYSGSVAEIIGIATSEKLRGQGIGKNMIRSVMESEHLERLEAQTDDDAIGFYRKCGFDEEKIVVDYPNGSVVRYNCVIYRQA